MVKSRIILFVGTVGSGKSTHARLLYLELKRRGVKAKISFLKTGHLLAFVLEIFLAKILAGRRRDVYPIRALIEEKPYLFRRTFRLWLGLDLVSITIKFLISIYLPLKLGYTVLVEEYIPAAISDYIYLSRILKSSLKINSFTIRYLLRLMSLCGFAQTIFLDAEDNELLSRWRFRRSPNEVEDYLQMQRTILLHISKELSHNFLHINTSTKTLNKVHKLIIDHIWS